MNTPSPRERRQRGGPLRDLRRRLRKYEDHVSALPMELKTFVEDGLPLEEGFGASTEQMRAAVARKLNALSVADADVYWGSMKDMLIQGFHECYQEGVHLLWSQIITAIVRKIRLKQVLTFPPLLKSKTFDDLLIAAQDFETTLCGDAPSWLLEHLSLGGRRTVLSYCVAMVVAGACATFSNEQDVPSRYCCVCLAGPMDAPLSCGHMNACQSCVLNLVREHRRPDGELRCPVCQQDVETRFVHRKRRKRDRPTP